MRLGITPLLLIAAGLLVAGCSETRLLTHAAKQMSRPPEAPTAPPTRSAGGYKVGTPYQINGVWYYPQEDRSYDQTGIASWYGEPFHGRATANGELFDQNELSAAHQTLPMPTYVRVTNLENGRSIVVKINDRGPFVNGRIIDMSRRSAQLLGFEQQGTAKVRVQYVGPAAAPVQDLQLTEAQQPIVAAPRPTVVAEVLAPPPGVKAEAPVPVLPPAPTGTPATTMLASANALPPVPLNLESQPIEQQAVHDTGIYIQAGAFSQFDNANRLSARLAGIGPTRVSSAMINGAEFFRVRIGPLASVAAADAALAQVIASGQSDAKVVVDAVGCDRRHNPGIFAC